MFGGHQEPLAVAEMCEAEGVEVSLIDGSQGVKSAGQSAPLVKKGWAKVAWNRRAEGSSGGDRIDDDNDDDEEEEEEFGEERVA